MFKCLKFRNLESRVKKCTELKLCTFCTSNKHDSKDCLGNSNKLTYECKICKKNSY